MGEVGCEVVLVTGGAGFLGQHIIKLLHEKGEGVAEIRSFDIKPYYNNLGHKEVVKTRSIVGNLVDKKALRDALMGVHSVIHTASVVSMGSNENTSGMEMVNVQGTAQLIELCIELSVHQLVYTSTVAMFIGYDDIIDVDESSPIPPKYLYPGYADTKSRAERAVLDANGSDTSAGHKLQTIVIKPLTMYGEQDCLFVTDAITQAKTMRGVLPVVGTARSIQQVAYVGNTAWGHVLANNILKKDPLVGGNNFIITDDTPRRNAYYLFEEIIKPRGYSLSRCKIPFFLVYFVLYIKEFFMWLVSPIVPLKNSYLRTGLYYVTKTSTFKGTKAEELLGYQPLFTYKESLDRSLKYYNSLDI